MKKQIISLSWFLDRFFQYYIQLFQNEVYNAQMKIIYLLLIAYGSALLVILHATLLFCGGQHCIISFQKPPVPHQVAYHLRVGISALLPFELKTLQVIAQWIVIGQIMLFFIWVIKRLQQIICCLIWIVWGFVVTMAFLAFFSHSKLSHFVSQSVLSSDLVSQQQLNEFMKTVNETIYNFKDFLK